MDILLRDGGCLVEESVMLATDRTILNLTDQRVEDDLTLRPWLLALAHLNDPNPCPEGDPR